MFVTYDGQVGRLTPRTSCEDGSPIAACELVKPAAREYLDVLQDKLKWDAYLEPVMRLAPRTLYSL
jgi:hypothetical protein